MSISNAQRSGFDDRLSRIKKGGANTMGEVHIGPRDEERARKGKNENVVRMKKKKNQAVKSDGSTVVLAPIGVLLGGISMFVGQAANYQIFNEGGLLNLAPPVEALAPFMQYAPFLFGGILALMFAWTFRLTSGLRLLALLGGFGAVFYYQADLIQTMPGMYANFFSPEFVKAALAKV